MKQLFTQGINGMIMHMAKNLKSNQQGVASMITVLFVSIILSIVVLGFIRIAINEQRQAADDDLSTRAFYAAESGIEDAKRAILEELNDFDNSFALNEDVCTPPDGYNNVISAATEFDVEYTCMLIDNNPPDYQTFLQKGESVVIHLKPKAGESYNGVKVDWHLNATPPDGDGVNPAIRDQADDFLPTEAAWQAGSFPAMLRAYLFSYDAASSITRSDLTAYTTLAFLNPTDRTGNPPTNHNPAGSSGSAINEGIVPAVCDTANTYVCTVEFQLNSSGEEHYIRLTSLYDDTHIKVTLFTGNPLINPVDFEAGQQVLVDVTGRAADVFRRVEARLDLDRGLSDLLPDYAIFSADNLCKDFFVSDTSFFNNTTCS